MADNIYAELADVKRILRLTDDNQSRDAELQEALDAIESWASNSLPGIGTASPDAGVTTAKFYDVAEDATLHTDPDDAQIVEVRAFRRGVEFDIPLVDAVDAWTALHTGTSYEATPEGDVILRRNATVSPFEGALAERMLEYYDHVEVDYTSAGTVPRGVREGVAYLAAGYWTDTPRALSGTIEEHIGDYMWRNENAVKGVGEGDPSYVRHAMFFLRPYMRRTNRVTVT